MPDLPLRIEALPGGRPGVRVLKLEGPLTVANSFEFQDLVRSDRQNSLIVDLSEVPYIDSTGVGCLVNGYVSHQNAGQNLLLVGVAERVQVCMRVTHVENLFPTFPTVAEAEKSVAANS
ncbi:MAG: STAS domain-containing protein [Terriglobales bacterium]|jgi:anti-sigma B factor antagonist